ncbi:MAG TPA: CerR family C-terminal domain-containing protein, partial [Gemmatimonadota bacterium]|nr:CerR family C-terminal domain-containing protein [Gemmatimonadota bacterium]
ESRGGGPEEAGGRDTRSRLVEAAARLFARDGFRRVTVREICGEADANVASVSYYFGDKLGLYREVVRGAIERIQGADPTIEAPAGSSAEARVRHYVRTFLPRLARPAGPAVWMQRIMGHEMQEPTPLAPWIAERVVLPRVRYLADAVAELLGCEPEDPRVRRCVISLQAQCLFYMPNRFRREALPGWREPSDEELARVAEHVAAFSLAGIRHLARRGEADG